MFVDITAAEEYDIYLYALEANANLTSYSLTFIASSGKTGGKRMLNVGLINRLT